MSLAGIDDDRLRQPCGLPGLDLRLDGELPHLSELAFDKERLAIDRRDSADGPAPPYDNLVFGPGDAEVFSSLLRWIRRRRVVEVGSDHSRRFASTALAVNRAAGSLGRHMHFEPCEPPKRVWAPIFAFEGRLASIRGRP